MQVTRVSLAIALLLGMVTSALAQDRPRIVVVNYALQSLAQRLAGDSAEVLFPVPDGVDPSFWRPSIADISLIQSADLILLNGAGFATWVDRVSLPRSKLVNTSAAIADQFIVTESITHSHGDGGEHSHEGLASYTWLDPSLAVQQAEAIAAAMTRLKVAPAQDVEARLVTLRADLEALDAANQVELTKLQDTAIIATHPRYQYFTRRYGLSIASLEWDARSDPTNEQLAELNTLVQKTGARILIWEGEPSASSVAAAAAMGLESVVFNPLAQRGVGDDFVDAFAAAVDSISDAVEAQ